MKRISGIQAVINFIGRHPGCTFREIIDMTGLEKSVVNSAIWAMFKDGRVTRQGEYRNYRYALTKHAVVKGDEMVAISDFNPYYGCSNPLTHMFNQRLAEVRSGRMG